ncbi:glycosyltransferase, partial [Streptomyces sp. NPDC058953]|uniref:glycosyltransferase n=1 Tax=Streptomyces sp. NPDC058953 TaxID=3346676 RepID=UPI0036A0459B
ASERAGRSLTRGVRALYLGTERLGGVTVAVSDTVAERLAEWGVPPYRIHTVPNGIDAARFRFDPSARAAVRARLGIAPDTYAIGGVGRLVPGKRFDSVLRTVAAIPGTVALLAGAGPEHPRLSRLAGELGVTERVHFLGDCGAALPDGTGPSGTGRAEPGPPLPGGGESRTAAAVPGARSRDRDGRPDVPAAGVTVPDLLGALDLFVSASREEAFGLAVVEALAAGVPVVYRTCPAVADLPPGEVPGARRVGAADAELIAAVRDAIAADRPPGREPAPGVARYDIRRTAERVAAVYTHLLDGAPPPLPHQTSHPDPIERAHR